MCRNQNLRSSGRASSVSTIAGPGGRKAGRRLIWPALILLLGLTLPRVCLADGNVFDLYPKWVRPGPEAIVRVMIPGKIDVNRKIFLRLTLPKFAVTDLPLAPEQTRRRVADVMIQGPLRRGIYSAELVSEEGLQLAKGPDNIKVAAAERPVITAVLPKMVYPSNDRYDFEIIGENFDHCEEEKINVRINDVLIEDFKKCKCDATGKLLSRQEENNLPCLLSGWRDIQIRGLSLDRRGIGRPLEVSVEIDRLVSEPKPLKLSYVHRYTPIAVAFLVLGATVALIYFLFIRNMPHPQNKKTTYPKLACLFIDPQTNTYSLSKLQMVIWAAAAIAAYSYLAACQFLVQWKLGIPNVPEGLPMLLGISATTTALAVGATEFRGSKGAGMVNPGMADFITNGGVFAPERLQFFVWTILGAITFVAATLAQDPGTATEMASIPDTFNQLMGASSLGYLAGKFTRKPGPVIKSLMAPDPSGNIRIIGENLSPRAELLLDGAPSSDRIAPVEGAEFVSELTIRPAASESGAKPIAHLKIKNPDGQIAEWNENVPPVVPKEEQEPAPAPQPDDADTEKSEG